MDHLRHLNHVDLPAVKEKWCVCVYYESVVISAKPPCVIFNLQANSTQQFEPGRAKYVQLAGKAWLLDDPPNIILPTFSVRIVQSGPDCFLGYEF